MRDRPHRQVLPLRKLRGDQAAHQRLVDGRLIVLHTEFLNQHRS